MQVVWRASLLPIRLVGPVVACLIYWSKVVSEPWRKRKVEWWERSGIYARYICILTACFRTYDALYFVTLTQKLFHLVPIIFLDQYACQSRFTRGATPIVRSMP